MKVLSLAAAVVAVCAAAPTSDTRPFVHIGNGTLVGNSTNGIDSFFGIPYAKPPIRNLRLQPPESIDRHFGTLELVGTALEVPACTQMTLTPANLTAITKIPEADQSTYYGTNTGFGLPYQEDCLTINVQRPANIPAGTKLPVLFWIYGGGFEIGSTQVYDGQTIINQSVSMGEPIVFVAVNYRLNAFGFLQGKQLQEAGATNLGLRDQRKALQWVAENIETFGGDPDRVTLWGESAGAYSVFNHLTAYNGDHTYNGKPLFRGAMMNSGSFVPGQSAVSTKAQRAFDDFSTYAGCPPTSYGNGSEILDCLRDIPYSNYVAAMNLLPNFASGRSNDLAYLPRPDPSSDIFPRSGEEAARDGRYAHVPIIIGNTQDEATPFVASQKGLIHNTKTLVDFFASWFTETPRTLVEGFINTYSQNPADGLPAGTGSQYQIYPLSKTNAAIQTDITFGFARRIFLSYAARQMPAWSFLATYQQGLPWWGTQHTSDLATQFGQKVNTYAGQKMDEAYIHFVNFLDPNGNKSETEPWWPTWTAQSLQMANFSKSEIGVTKDDFRWDSFEFYNKHASQLRI